uniref:DOMON domain-containing protein n=1 Tax=Eutreptiella gymnastica TaxID=73025 RepID=A0A7S4GBQ2_9EUGL
MALAVMLSLCPLHSCDSGPSLSHRLMFDAGSQFILQWTADIPKKMLRLCATAQCSEHQYISLGFGGGYKMQDMDMVAAFLEEDGTAVTRTYYSETPVGFPTGRPTMEIRNVSQVFDNGTAHLCFTRPFHTGHHPIQDGTFVSWAIGSLWDDDMDDHGMQRGTQKVQFLSARAGSEL